MPSAVFISVSGLLSFSVTVACPLASEPPAIPTLALVLVTDTSLKVGLEAGNDAPTLTFSAIPLTDITADVSFAELPFDEVTVIVLPAPQSGQLLAFSRFRSKDPFSQQLDLNCASGDGQGCPSSSGTTSGGGTKPPVKPSAQNGTLTVTPSKGGAAKPTSAVISVNGASQTVRVGASFPASAPTFKLVSVTKASAQVGIAGGSLASGNQTVTLRLGKQLTLMNTADGTRYVLRLVSVK